jgi:hypothetical protein
MKAGGRIRLIERRKDREIFYDALVLGMTMRAELAGTRNEPAIRAVFVNPLRVLTQDDPHQEHMSWYDQDVWNDVLIKVDQVVHVSHRDWLEGRTCIAYQEAEDLVSAGDHDLERIATGEGKGTA